MLSVNQHTVDTAKMLLFHRSEIKIILLITKLYHSLFTHKTNSSLTNRKSHTVIHVAGRKDRARPIPRTLQIDQDCGVRTAEWGGGVVLTSRSGSVSKRSHFRTHLKFLPRPHNSLKTSYSHLEEFNS